MKNWFWNEVKRLLFSRVFIKYFLLIFLCICIPFLTLGTVLLVSTSGHIRSKAEQEYRYAFTAACNELDAEMVGLRNTAYHISELRWCAKMLALPEQTLRERVTPFSRLEALKSVRIISSMVSAAADIAVCFPSQDAVFTSTWFDTLDAFFSIDIRYPDMEPEQLKDLLTERNQMHVIPLTTVQRLGRMPADYLTIVQTLSPNGGWEDGSVIFFISFEYLQGIFRAVLMEDGIVSICDGDGRPIFATGQMIPPKEGFSIRLPLPGTGWLVYSAIPHHAAQAELRILYRYTLYLGCLILALAIAVSFALARKYYAPIWEVASAVSGDARAELSFRRRGPDEFGFVVSQWQNMNKRLVLYKKKMEDYHLLARLYCMESLLDTSPGSAERAKQYLSILGTELSGSRVRCVLLINADLPAHDIDRQIAAPHFSSLTALLRANTVLLCSYDTQADFLAFQQRLDALLAENGQKHAVRIAGPEQERLDGFPRSYHAANLAVERLVLSQEEGVSGWLFADPIAEDVLHIRFAPAEEETLINLLKIGDAKGAVEHVSAILKKNRSLPGNVVMYLYHILLILPFRVLEEDVTRACYGFFMESMQASGPDKMEEHLCKLYADVCQIQISRISSYDDDITNWLVEYVEANVYNPILSLKLLGDEFSLSVSQVSRLFQKKMGVGFAEWLTVRRIRHAQELLQSFPGMEIAQVGFQCGYSSDISFRRAFKKHTGLTPGDYRSLR